MIDLDELLASMEVQTNVLLEANRIAEQQRRNFTAMLQIDSNGLTCKAEGCFSKADFFGSNTHFCGSHMLIKVAS